MTSRSTKGAENSDNLAELFSQITVEELQAAADEKNPKQTPLVKKLMKSMSTSCKAMGHTPEAAAYARRCCFAIQDRFGLNSIFLTVTPDDEKNFRNKTFDESWGRGKLFTTMFKLIQKQNLIHKILFYWLQK